MEDDLNKEILWVLKELKKAQILLEKRDFSIEGFTLLYNNNTLFKEKTGGPDDNAQWRIIESLEDNGYIKTKNIPVLGNNPDNTRGFEIKLIEPKFTLLMEKLTKDSNQKENKKEKKISKKKILYLDAEGNFCREPKKDYCYSMKKNSDRHKIIRFLAENPGYRQTPEITSYLNEKINRWVYSDIKNIRRNITKFLGIDGSDLIESKKGSGFRINPKYEIKVGSW